jgi:hypothetical protein
VNDQIANSRPTSESLTGPDGRTSSIAKMLAKNVRFHVWKSYPTTSLHQTGYGPASFDVDMGDNLIATITVDVKRAKSTP